MEASLSQKEKIAAAKKKLKRFQQKSARLEKVANRLQFFCKFYHHIVFLSNSCFHGAIMVDMPPFPERKWIA